MNPWFRIAAMSALAAVPVACNVLVGDYTADLVDDPSVSSELHCQVERDAFVFEIDLSSEAALADLPAYFDAANPEITGHLSGVATAYQNGDSHARVTYIMGAAGVGKSFVARNILGGFSDTEKCTVKLSDLFGEDQNLLSFAVAPMPDLATLDGGLVFNELPTVADPSQFDLPSLFDAAGCNASGQLPPLIIIDDLDEVHDSTCTKVLEEVDEFILSGAPGAGHFVHVVVFGRSEGFYAWLADPRRNEQNNAIVDLFVLNAPRYQTAGDLEFRVIGYLDFTEQLAGIESAGLLPSYIESTTTAVANHGFLTYSTGNLAVGNIVVAQTAPGLDLNEEQLKQNILDELLVRAADTHGRPEPGTELGGPYLRALEDIAVRYPNVSEQGVFIVRSEDTIVLKADDGTGLGEVRVRDVIDRSGIAVNTTANAATSRYRFEPFWIHGHLIERHNQREIDGYGYRNCE